MITVHHVIIDVAINVFLISDDVGCWFCFDSFRFFFFLFAVFVLLF